MRELDELLTSTLRVGERGLAAQGLGQQAFTALTARVAARRRRRRVLQGVAAVPVVAALAVGAWVLAGRTSTPAPVVTQTPAPTVTTPAPSPSPTPTPTPTASAEPTTVFLAEHVAATPLTAATLARARDGWGLVVLGDVWTGDESGGDAPPPDGVLDGVPGAVLDLVAPDGTHYRTPDPDGVIATVPTPLVWDVGSRRALVEVRDLRQGPTGDSSSDSRCRVGWLDLLTGRFEAVWTPEVVMLDDHWPQWPWFLGRAADGSAVFEVPTLTEGGEGSASLVAVAATGAVRTITEHLPTFSSRLGLDPTGTHALVAVQDGFASAFGVVDLATGDLTPVDRPAQTELCMPLTWWSADAVLTGCRPGAELSWRLYVQPITGDAPYQLPDAFAGALPDVATLVGDGDVILQSATNGLVRWDGRSAPTVLASSNYPHYPPIVAGGLVVTTAVTDPYETLVAIPLAGGPQVVLAPVVPVPGRDVHLQAWAWLFGGHRVS